MNGVKTSYTWDGSQLVSQKTGNEAIHFLYHGSSRVGLEYKGNTYYYIYNLQGDVVGLVNSNGTTVAVSYTHLILLADSTAKELHGGALLAFV